MDWYAYVETIQLCGRAFGPVVGGSRRGFEPPHRTCWDFPGFPSGGASRAYGSQWDDVPVTLHSVGVCVYRL